MKANEYINSGNLEEYCFDMFNPERQQEIAGLASLHPEIKKELNEIELVIEKFAMSQAVEPRPELRERLFGALGFHDDEILDINNLPATNKYSDYTQWLKAVEHLIPAEPFEDFFAEVLQSNEHIAQMLVVTKLNVPEETHQDIAESFFILKGQCACTVGNEVFTLNAGDYLDIPLHINHDVKILSPYVIAILQHKFA
nr:cupin domain-containing protein [uncultured Mucilaginibacter sp.]